METRLAELTEREISDIHRENTGPSYRRIAAIKDRVLEAHIEAALIPAPVCDFVNKYGHCKLDKGHSGTHTVIWLGGD